MPSADIISRLSTRFKNGTKDRDHGDFLTRDIGGQFRNNQWYISGYFQVVFGLPIVLFNNSAEDAQEASKWLHTTCENFSWSGYTINSGDVTGLGQIGSSFPTSGVTTREFTMAFREMQNMPILTTFRRWCPFDPYTGISPLKGNQFIPSNYKGWAAVIQTKPTRSRDESIEVEDLEECYIFQGVWPKTVPYDTLANSDLTSNDTIQMSVTFSFDGHPFTSAEPGIAEKTVELFNGLKVIGDPASTFERYKSGIDAMSPWGAHGNTDVGSSVSITA